MNARRLAALDLQGTSGSARRRRLVLTEFAAGLCATVTVGVWFAIGTVGRDGRIFGVWLLGVGLNYALLLGHAITLSRPGALEAELADTDIGLGLRRYSMLQLWILVPASLYAVGALTRD